MKIPKIIHQTWKDDDIPVHFQPFCETWKEKHPDWRYILWTDLSAREFVVNYYPHLIKIYDGYEFNIQRADVIRYLVLDCFGGLYVDLDFECLKNTEPLLNGHECVFGLEPEDHLELFGVKSLICNAFMACTPAHPFIKLVIENLKIPSGYYSNPNLRVMHSTGPLMINRVYDLYKDKKQLAILNEVPFYPLTRDEVQLILRSGTVPTLLEPKLAEAYAVHYWFNTWIDFSYKTVL